MHFPPHLKLCGWNDCGLNGILKYCSKNTQCFQKNSDGILLWCMSTVLILLKAPTSEETRLRRHLFSSYDAVILDQMALLPLGLTWVWINIPDSYLTFIKHVIGSGPWLIWTHQFVLSHREVRTISLFTRMGIFICLRGW